jgi:rhomboid protease GluP
MELKTYIKANWLTKNPKSDGLTPTLILMSLLLLSSFIYLNNFFNAPLWMSATGELVFEKHQWWRAWTTLFAHGDLTHIFSNLFLFFPLFGFFAGGLVNLMVLQTMPAHVGLIGVSGVVNWMGGAWLALAWLIDRRESSGRRVLKVVAVTIVLFVPDSFKPDVSYLSHFLGYFLGIFSGIAFYFMFKKKFDSEEIVEVIPEDDNLVWGADMEFYPEEQYVIDQQILNSQYHQKES